MKIIGTGTQMHLSGVPNYGVFGSMGDIFIKEIGTNSTKIYGLALSNLDTTEFELTDVVTYYPDATLHLGAPAVPDGGEE